MAQKKPLIVVSILLLLSLAGNWYMQRKVQREQKSKTELVEKNKKQKQQLANYDEVQPQKETSTAEKDSTASEKDVSENLESLIVLIYSSKNKGLNDRYEKFKPLITGEAVQQLKPQSKDDDDDYINVPNQISNIVVYPKVENGKYSALATYDMENKIDKKTYTNHMIMSVDFTKENGEMLISKIKFNSGINN